MQTIMMSKSDNEIDGMLFHLPNRQLTKYVNDEFQIEIGEIGLPMMKKRMHTCHLNIEVVTLSNRTNVIAG